jgi:hypothetical protein
MKFKTTIILFALFLVLLGAVLFFESREKGKKEKEEKLVSLPSDSVQKISFKKEDGTMTFQKDEKGEWLITEPLQAKADKYEVDRIAQDFSDLKIERVVERQPKSLEKYEIPKTEITLWLKGQEKPVKILIGLENPLDSTFFAKKEEETRVVLIPSHLKSLMEKKLIDFRQKDIFKFETNEVKGVKLRAKNTRWEAEKKEEEWFLKSPVQALAESSKIEGIISSLSNLKAKDFVSEEKKEEEIKKYGLDKAEYEIALAMPLANKEVTFLLHKDADKLYATTSQSSKIITTEDSLLSDLEKEAKELREKSVAKFYSWEANKLHIKKAEIDWTLAKDKDDNWSFESPTKDPADKDKVQSFIRKVESLEASEFIDPPFNLKDYGLDSPQAEVKIWTKEKGEKEEKVKEITVFIGKQDKEAKKVVVKNARFDYLFRVDSAFLEEFPKELKDWKKPPEKKEEGKK